MKVKIEMDLDDVLRIATIDFKALELERMNAERARQLGYFLPKLLSDGRVIALMQFIYTVGLVVDIDDRGNYQYRYCFPDMFGAMSALAEWDGEGDPPGDWLKKKGDGADVGNPRLLRGIPIVIESDAS